MVLIGLVKCQFHDRNGKLERNPTWDLIHWTWTQNMYLSTIKIINLILKIRKNELKLINESKQKTKAEFRD